MGCIMENELTHYGVPGMRWGKRSLRYEKKIGRIDKRNVKLEKKVTTGLKKAHKVQVINDAKKSRLNAKLRVAKVTFNRDKAERITSKMMSLEMETMMARSEVTKMQDRINRNKKLQEKLKMKMDRATQREAEAIKNALTNL